MTDAAHGGQSVSTNTFLLNFLPVLVVLFLSVKYFPPIYSISDEAGYFSMAHVIAGGSLFPDNHDVFVAQTVQGINHRVSLFPPGWPILLAPLSFLGWRSLFVLPLVIHIVGYLYFWKILRRLEIDDSFAFLYLLYPGFLFYSRTLMSDLPAAVLFLMGFYYCLQERRFFLILAGVLFGMNIFLRYSSIILAAIMILIEIFQDMSVRKKIHRYKSLHLILGFLPFVAALACYQKLALGNAFAIAYNAAGFDLSSSFGLRYFLPNLLRYSIALNLVYPFMAASLLFYRGRSLLEISACAVTFLLFYSFYFWFSFATSLYTTVVVGIRFLLPVIPLFLIGYLDFLDRRIFRKVIPSTKSILRWIALISLTGLAVVLCQQHDHYLQRQKRFSDFIYQQTPEGSSIIANIEVSEMMQSIWGKRKVLDYNLLEINEAMKQSPQDLYFITNNKNERTNFVHWNENFKKELEQNFQVTQKGNIREEGWELEVNQVSPKM